MRETHVEAMIQRDIRILPQMPFAKMSRLIALGFEEFSQRREVGIEPGHRRHAPGFDSGGRTCIDNGFETCHWRVVLRSR